MANKTYDANSISVLEGLEAVRTPWNVHWKCIYQGIEYLIYEIVDNFGR